MWWKRFVGAQSERQSCPDQQDPPPSASLVQLRGLTEPKALPSGNGTKILHNDSSDTLLPM